jgi:hypothetical protein
MSAGAEPDPFASVMRGTTRGAQRTNWEELSAADREHAVEARLQCDVRSFWNSGWVGYSVSAEMARKLANVREQIEEAGQSAAARKGRFAGTPGGRLYAFEDAALAAYGGELRATARRCCEQLWNAQHLSCGHGPSVNHVGGIGMYENDDGTWSCPSCWCAHGLAAFAAAEDRFEAILRTSDSLLCLGCLGENDGIDDVLARIDANGTRVSGARTPEDNMWEDANGVTHWRATDIHGRRWYGRAGKDSPFTIMRRSRKA